MSDTHATLTVFVLTIFASYEGETLYGAYSTHEAAEAAVEALDDDIVPGETVCIRKIEIDASPRARTVLGDHEGLVGEHF